LAGERQVVKINLGCGYRKIDGFVNLDYRPEVDPDMVCDCRKLPFDDNSVDEVRAVDFLEHIPTGQTIGVINEIWRVLKHGGKFMHETPSTDGRGAFQDPTHVSFWNVNSWLYFMNDQYRKLYDIKAKFSGENEDVWSGMGICHTKGNLTAEKRG
jgi:predicted SAM-dependent methyltransferase